MSTQDKPGRAVWIAAVRKVLDLIETRPDLPLPAVTSRTIAWNVYTDERRQVAALEKALGIPFAGAIDPETDHYYILSGDLDGMPVTIRTFTSEIVEKQVTGTRVVETVEWVRLPVEDEQDENDTEGEQG